MPSVLQLCNAVRANKPQQVYRLNPNYAVGGEVPQFSREAELSALVGFTTPDRHRDRKSPFGCH